jgi:hypothetical protein
MYELAGRILHVSYILTFVKGEHILNKLILTETLQEF